MTPRKDTDIGSKYGSKSYLHASAFTLADQHTKTTVTTFTQLAGWRTNSFPKPYKYEPDRIHLSHVIAIVTDNILCMSIIKK